MLHHAGHTAGLSPVGFLSLTEPIAAVAATFNTVYVATNELLIEINVAVPSAPVVTRRLSSPGRVRALSADGDTLRVLADDGLHTLDLSRFGEARTVAFDPDVRGHSLMGLGRSVYVGGGDIGLRQFHDTSTEAATFNVQVGDIFFNPAGAINLNVNDTVRWQKPGTVFPHNVRSCSPGETGCGGAAATQSFFSGFATTSAFNFQFTFTLPGNNLYICQAHPFSMVGDVQVAGGGAPPPPGIPDGQGAGTPMRVAKLSIGGANLRVIFDTGCPDAVNHDLLFGPSSSLPTFLGGPYTPPSAACATGGSPFFWNGVPSPAPGDFLWWVIVADDGVAPQSTEGTWGKASIVGERNGNNPSGLCFNGFKDTTNPCGQ